MTSPELAANGVPSPLPGKTRFVSAGSSPLRACRPNLTASMDPGTPGYLYLVRRFCVSASKSPHWPEWRPASHPAATAPQKRAGPIVCCEPTRGDQKRKKKGKKKPKKPWRLRNQSTLGTVSLLLVSCIFAYEFATNRVEVYIYTNSLRHQAPHRRGFGTAPLRTGGFRFPSSE